MRDRKVAVLVVLSIRIDSDAKAEEYGPKVVEEACFRLQQQLEQDPSINAQIAEEAGIDLPNAEEVRISEYSATLANEFLE
jgi:hypothetical protein